MLGSHIRIAILILLFTVVCNVLWCNCAYLKNKIIKKTKKKTKQFLGVKQIEQKVENNNPFTPKDLVSPIGE